ncbi:hypothetical protein C0Q70_20835 [Pomacea canaliculata]|uniref:Ileal sodium/bile acid cotransporter n=1 Tax=Pomacea canaliculata TaxID=400727 RepID=A0A2T7NAT6_POMCA|nr:hypothetical protein C0Q70_20835 [Pomacea canaliculata]
MTTRALALVAAVVAISCLLWHQTLSHNLSEDNKPAKNDGKKFRGRYLENTSGVRENTAIANGGPYAAALVSTGSEATSNGDGLNDTSNDIIDISVQLPVLSYPFPLPSGVVIVFMNSVEQVTVNFTLRCSSSREKYVLEVVLNQQERHFVARLAEPVNVSISCSEAFSGLPAISGIRNVSGTFNISIVSGLLGKGVLRFFLTSLHKNGSSIGDGEMDVGKDNVISDDSTSTFLVRSSDLSTSATSRDDDDSSARRQVHQTFILIVRQQEMIDDIFRIATFIIVALATVGMGCKTDLAVVREVLKKPFAPAVGFVSHLWVGADDPARQSCRQLRHFHLRGMSRGWHVQPVFLPAGRRHLAVRHHDNHQHYRIAGDAASMAVHARRHHRQGAMEQLTIPYVRILQILALIIVPLFVGILVRYQLPRVKKFILKVITPFSLLTVLFFVTVGIYANRFIFELLDPMTILAGCLLPYIGYIIGGIFALICRQPWFRVKTIAIETGVQNVGVAFLILLFSLPAPDGELAAVGPAASALMTPLPIFVMTVAYMTYNKCKGRPLTGRKDKPIKDTILQERLSKEMEVVTGKMVDDTD